MTVSVAVVMGSQSDWETMKEACDALTQFGVSWKAEVVSAHRTPQRMYEFASSAADQGYKVIIAGAGGLDSLLSIVQMPKGVAVGTLAIGSAGAYNAGLLAAQMLGSDDPALQKRIADWKVARADQVLADAELGQG